MPWYNLRKSFCSDLLETATDISFYEYTTDHSYKVATRHYQILHADRLRRGMKKSVSVFDSLEDVGARKEACWGKKRDLQGVEETCEDSQQSDVSSSIFPLMQNKKPACKTLQTGVTERTGFEPAVGFKPYDGLANRCFRPLSHLSNF